MDKNLQLQTTFLAKPVGLLGLAIVLLIMVYSVGIGQVKALSSKIASSTKTVAGLEEKVKTLESISQVLPGDVTFLDIVLPSKGAVLYAINQVKYQAINNNVAISGIKTGSSVLESSGVYKNSVSFEVEGDEVSTFNFLESFSKILPLMNVDKVSINKAGDLLQSSVTLTVYSSELPKKLPNVTDSVKELTSEEVKILKEVSSYQMPLFVEPKADTGGGIKANPFGE